VIRQGAVPATPTPSLNSHRNSHRNKFAFSVHHMHVFGRVKSPAKLHPDPYWEQTIWGGNGSFVNQDQV
jgi:hypothetical protein